MLRVDAIKAATDDLITAALLDDGWEAALSRLSLAAEASGVVLIRNRNRQLIAAIANAEIAEPVAHYLAGRAPPNSRQVRVNHDTYPGFRIDADDYTNNQIARDCYYQEYLRPLGLFWHANARIAHESVEELAITFKRALKVGPYDHPDALALNSMLPDVKAAVRIARHVLDAQASGMVRMLHRRGHAIFEFDAWGRVHRLHGFIDDETRPVRVFKHHLVTVDSLAQDALDRTVLTAVRSPQRTAMLSLLGPSGEPYYLQMIPVGGRARDVFLASAAVGVLIQRTPRQRHVSFPPSLIRDVFALTDREVDVAALLAEGRTLIEIAKHLRVQVGTARNHLKSVFEKTGTGRQAELVALLALLMP